MPTTTTRPFENWLALVDGAVQDISGEVCLDDLPDALDLADLHDSGLSPIGAARLVLKTAGFPL